MTSILLALATISLREHISIDVSLSKDLTLALQPDEESDTLHYVVRCHRNGANYYYKHESPMVFQRIGHISSAWNSRLDYWLVATNTMTNRDSFTTILAISNDGRKSSVIIHDQSEASATSSMLRRGAYWNGQRLTKIVLPQSCVTD